MKDHEQPRSVSRIQHLPASRQQSARLRQRRQGEISTSAKSTTLGSHGWKGGGGGFEQGGAAIWETVTKTSKRTARYHGCFLSRQQGAGLASAVGEGEHGGLVCWS